jgi:phage shock protein C
VNDRLYRSRDDRVIGGVCAGLAERLDLDPALVRVGWFVLTILTGGVLFLLYIVMLIVVPEEPAGGVAWTSRPPDPGAVPGWTPPPPGAGWAPPGGPRPGDPVAGWTAPDAASSPPSPAPPEAAQGAPAAPPPPAPTAWTSPMDTRAARRAARRERRAQRDPMIGLFFGAILVLIGLYFLARQYVPALEIDRFWPLIVIVVGVLLVVRAFSRPRPDA